MFIRIEGGLRDYAWGKPGGVSEVLGRSVGPDGGIEAEYWLATDELLLKVLAAAEALSLQVHPDAALAAAGFAREESAGIPIDAAYRSYKDLGAKAELILALSDRFEALSGFRSAQSATQQFALLIDAAGPEALGGAAALLPMLASDDTVGDAFLWLVSDAGRPLVDLLLPAVQAQAVAFPVQAWLADLHPGDAGVIAALLLNHVVLRRGEVLATWPGTIHAYLYGTGIELMVNSDNVLRAGITPKHVDLAELGRAVNVRASAPVMLESEPFPGGDGFRMRHETGELILDVIQEDATRSLMRDALVLCVEGTFTLVADGESLVLVRGDAASISGADAVGIVGDGVLYLAR